MTSYEWKDLGNGIDVDEISLSPLLEKYLFGNYSIFVTVYNTGALVKMEVHVSTRALFVAVFLFSQTSVSLGRKSHTISLTDDNWRQLLEGEWMVEL